MCTLTVGLDARTIGLRPKTGGGPVIARSPLLLLLLCLPRPGFGFFSQTCEAIAAGRSTDKLADLRKSLDLDEGKVVLCDCTDPESLDTLVQQCKVVANFAGTPFADKALPVVEACTRHGTRLVPPPARMLHR